MLVPGGRGAQGPATTVPLQQSPGQLSYSLVYTTRHTTDKWQPLGNHTSRVQGLRAPLDRDGSWAGGRASPHTDSHTQTDTPRPRGPGTGQSSGLLRMAIHTFPQDSPSLCPPIHLSQMNDSPRQECPYYR